MSDLGSAPALAKSIVREWGGSGGALVLAAALVACGAEPAAERDAHPNLLLISIDTLRADALGTYGYDRGTSDHIDELAAAGVVFEEAYSAVSWTLPSLASFMTSLYPSTHECWNFESRLDGSFLTLAEILRDAGYHTGGVGSHVFLDAKRGLQQGFDDYDDELVLSGMGKSHEAITSQPITKKAVRMLEKRAKHPEQPWFLWIHYFDPHDVYQAHKGFSERFGTETERELYDGEVAYTDDAVGRLLTRLEGLGFAEDTVVVLTSDHGEEFGDHGGRHHGQALYRESVHVPWIVRAPGFAPRRVREDVRTVDFLPTVLELLDVALPRAASGIEGQSLVPAMRGEALDELPVLSELRLRAPGLMDSLRVGRWKLIVDRHRGHGELYDVDADPLEQHDLAAAEPEVVRQLTLRMDGMIAEARAKASAFARAGRLQLSTEELDELRKLGYVDGGE